MRWYWWIPWLKVVFSYWGPMPYHAWPNNSDLGHVWQFLNQAWENYVFRKFVTFYGIFMPKNNLRAKNSSDIEIEIWPKILRTEPIMKTRVRKWYAQELCLITIAAPPHFQQSVKQNWKNCQKFIEHPLWMS